VTPLPGFEGGDRAQIIGGDNLVVSAFSENPGGALQLVDFWTSTEKEIEYAAKNSLAPVLTAVYDDPAVKKAQPFAAELLEAVQNGKPRPVSPVYPQISQAIYKNVADALSAKATPEAALEKAHGEIEKALATF
jgi:multiple sugar transport system substrate-binding protein